MAAPAPIVLWLKTAFRRVPPLAIVPVGVASIAFLVDLKTPDDIADGFFYTFAVLSCACVPCANSALYTALGLMLPMTLGFLASLRPSVPESAVANRALAALLIWLVALVVWRGARLRRDREENLRELELLHDDKEQAASAERIELSLWLHEGLAQELVAVGWALDRLARHASDARKVHVEARELRAVVDSALRTVHDKAVQLRKLEAAPGALPLLVDRYVTEFIGRTGLPVELTGSKCLEAVPETYAILCFKIVQEALTNVAKHAGASLVRIDCRKESRALYVTITDDGRGIDSADRLKPDSLGLLGLHERLTSIGGVLSVSNVDPNGARIEAQLPLL